MSYEETNPDGPSALHPPTPEELRTIETFYRAFSGQPELLKEAVTADWLDIPPAPGQGPGPEGAEPMISAFSAAFSDLRITVQEVFGGSGRLGVRAEITGTHSGEWFGVAPSGKSVRIALHEFHHLEGGRIARTWHLEDWFGMLGQVGAWPPAKAEGSR